MHEEHPCPARGRGRIRRRAHLPADLPRAGGRGRGPHPAPPVAPRRVRGRRPVAPLGQPAVRGGGRPRRPRHLVLRQPAARPGGAQAGAAQAALHRTLRRRAPHLPRRPLRPRPRDHGAAGEARLHHRRQHGPPHHRLRRGRPRLRQPGLPGILVRPAPAAAGGAAVPQRGRLGRAAGRPGVPGPRHPGADPAARARHRHPAALRRAHHPLAGRQRRARHAAPGAPPAPPRPDPVRAQLPQLLARRGPQLSAVLDAMATTMGFEFASLSQLPARLRAPPAR